MTGLLKSIAQSRLRVSEYDFSRNGDLSPELLVTFLVYMVADSNRRGIRHLLAAFWADAEEIGLQLPRETPVSAPSICNARGRLNSEVFRDILYKLADCADAGVAARGEKTWRGRRVYVVDGQKLNLRRSEELDRHFGTPESAYCPQALYSVLVDVCARMPVDFELDGHRTSEREHLGRMLDSLESGDVLTLDRGYPSHALFQDLASRSIDFVVRVPASQSFAAIDQFRMSGKQDDTVTIEVPEDAPEQWQSQTLRLVRSEGPDGSAFYLTSLDVDAASHADIAALYRMRWEAEEYFKAFTSEYAGQRLFRSIKASGIRQEVGALTLLYAMSRIVAATANERLEVDGAYLSQKAAVLAMGALLMKVSLAPDASHAMQFIERTIQRLLHTLDHSRPGRSYPRHRSSQGQNGALLGVSGANAIAPCTRCMWRISAHCDTLITSWPSWIDISGVRSFLRATDLEGRFPGRASTPLPNPANGSFFNCPRGPFSACRQQLGAYLRREGVHDASTRRVHHHATVTPHARFEVSPARSSSCGGLDLSSDRPYEPSSLSARPIASSDALRPLWRALSH